MCLYIYVGVVSNLSSILAYRLFFKSLVFLSFAMIFRLKLLFFSLFQSACRPTSPCFTGLVIIITVRNAMYHRGRPTSREMTVEMWRSGGCPFSKRDHYHLTRENGKEKEDGEERTKRGTGPPRGRSKRGEGGRDWDREKVKKDESERSIEKSEKKGDERGGRSVWFTQQVIKSDVLGDRTLRRNDSSEFFFSNKLLIIPS